MSEPLTLHQLADRARVLEGHMADGKIAKDADALRERIDEGYAKVTATGLPADDPKVIKAQEKLAELEDQLSRTYRSILIPHYFEQAFLLIARDALKWSGVREGSRMRVLIPDVLDLTVSLDNLPEEAPF